ncbi:NAD(P)H-hydrate dehydratase [Patescibacteria group bacterium]|nr:NAD(P)H-hydrate dehydratase [Patescibacteria group bacterium]
MKKLQYKRNPWSHKGDFGYVLIVGGNIWYSGSPVFNAIPALRVGADIATVIAPKRSADIVASFAPDLIAYPLAGNYLRYSHVNEILKISKNYDSLIIGGGLGVNFQTKRAVHKILRKLKLPMVIDADAIKTLDGNLSIIKNKNVILTPNAAEFEKITKQSLKDEVKDRSQKAKDFAKQYNVVVILKGNIDIITDGKRTFENKSGSVYMTKGGFGDTLAGIAGSLLAQGYEPLEAARMAADINGKAGELAVKKYGRGVIASDIFETIPQIVKK